MKRLKIVNTEQEFSTLYGSGIPSNDVVLIKESDKIYMSTNNSGGIFQEYGASGTIDASTIEELGLVTTNDISAFVKNGNVGNLYIGSDTSSTGSSLVVVRQFQGQASETKLSNIDNRSALVNRVGGIDNARVILSHEGLMVSFSGDKDTSFPAQSKHVAYIEDTSVNFALKSELDGFVDSQDISTFITMNDVSNYALKSELDGFVDSQEISTFITMNDVSNYALKSELDGFVDSQEISTFITMNDVSTCALKSDLDYIVWQGTEAQYNALANHTDYKIYLITE